MNYYFLNGNTIPEDKAVISVRDIAILRGFAIFDFFRTVNGRPFMMDDYLKRFQKSAALMDLPLHYSIEDLKKIINNLLKKNAVKEAGIRLVLTGGESENAFVPAEPNFMILIEPVHFPDAAFYENGIKLITHHYQREWSNIKTTNYISAIKLIKQCRIENAFDVLYYFNNEVKEVTRSNVFLVKDNKIITPDKDILYGITRKKVLELASGHYVVQERSVSFDEIKGADEFFMTGTTKKVLPVIQIDDIRIADRKPGPVTRHLMRLFSDFEKKN